MFVRNITLRLIPGTFGEFTRALHGDVLPALKMQDGFRGEVVFPEGDAKVSILSFWDTKEQADGYDTAAHPGMKTLEHVLAGPPEVHTCAAISSAFDVMPATAAA